MPIIEFKNKSIITEPKYKVNKTEGIKIGIGISKKT
jgi:hypothetical protein